MANNKSLKTMKHCEQEIIKNNIHQLAIKNINTNLSNLGDLFNNINKFYTLTHIDIKLFDELSDESIKILTSYNNKLGINLDKILNKLHDINTNFNYPMMEFILEMQRYIGISEINCDLFDGFKLNQIGSIIQDYNNYNLKLNYLIIYDNFLNVYYNQLLECYNILTKLFKDDIECAEN